MRCVVLAVHVKSVIKTLADKLLVSLAGNMVYGRKIVVIILSVARQFLRAKKWDLAIP